MQSTSPEYNEDSKIIRLLDKIGGPFLLSSEERRRRILAVFSLLVMMIVMLFFSTYHFYRGHYIIVTWNGVGFFLSLSILLYIRKRGKTDAVDWMVGSGIILFCSMTTIFGRTESSIFYWAFLLPLMCFAVTGKNKGLVFSLLYFCINIFLMTTPEQMMLSKPYSSSFVVRFSIIYIIITFGTYYYESAHKMMIRDIQQSEEKYRTILESIEDGYYEVDLAGNFTFFNDSLLSIYGYSSEEMTGINYRQHVDKDTDKVVFQKFNEVYKTGKPSKGFDWQITRKDETKRDINASISLLKDSSGKPTGFRGVVRDITERKQSEKALQHSEEKYRTILENIEDGYYEVDFAGNLTFFNDSLCRLYGYPKEELTDINYKRYMDKVTSENVFKIFNKIYKTGEPSQGFDWQITRKDRTKRYFETSASLRRDSSGNPRGFRGISRDITKRKQAEELQRTFDSLRKAVGATIQVLISALEFRDPYTAGHQSRVADLARAIATEMGLTQDTIEGTHMAGTIHDIGKLSIPAEILTKPTKLSKLEFSLIQEHTHSGYEMLKNVESPWPLAEIVYQHHERMNGSGYPRNLKGDEILLEARIMAVADVVEAMASHRPYRPALGIETALEEIEKNKGILYDDVVSDTCLKLFREKGYQLT